MWFSFPVPFKKGNIVIKFEKNDCNIYWGEEGSMVMEGNVFLNDLHKEATNGDSTDMIAWGYFLDETGNISARLFGITWILNITVTPMIADMILC